MPSVSELLERESRKVDLERGHFERLLRRRDRKRRNQRIGAGALAITLALVCFVALTRAFSGAERPADESPLPIPTDTALRRDGEVIVFERLGTGPGWDLAAQDPETGEVRKIVETEGIIDCRDRASCESFVKGAEWSSDGRWVAFDVSFGGERPLNIGHCGPTVGIWVSDALGVPRQLTTPCEGATPADDAIEELWAWSPGGAQLAYARVDGETDELFVIDPTDGSRTLLGTADGDLTDLEWSADETRIAYADGGSVFEVQVAGGDRSLLADSFADIVNIEWSPDGTRIMVLDRERYRLQVMNADGSDLHILVEGEDACCDPEWSADGRRIAYMLSVGGTPAGFDYEIQIWTVSPDRSNAIKVFDSGYGVTGEDANPVWSPDGARVAWMSSSVWQVGNADGTGEAQPISELLYKSWSGGGGGFTVPDASGGQWKG